MVTVAAAEAAATLEAALAVARGEEAVLMEAGAALRAEEAAEQEER